MTQRPLLAVRDLKTHFFTVDGVTRAVDGVSFDVCPGETLGIVGESGCGKSVTALSIMRLLPPKLARTVDGSVTFEPRPRHARRSRDAPLRGNRIAMIFQEPMTSLNPVLTVGAPDRRVGAHPHRRARAAARARAAEMLRLVRIPDAERRLDDYPHQFSGGMRQRVMIAMALACNPTLLIADEPTTALDVTIQAQILDLMLELKERTGAAVILITHDLGVVAETCRRVIVMYAGRKVEEAATAELFDRPLHPYTRGLMASIPRAARRRPQAPPRRNPRHRAVAARADRRLRVRAALRLCGRALPRRAAGIARGRRRACGRLPRGRARARDGGRRMNPVVEVADLKKHFPLRRGLLARSVAHDQGGRRRQLRDQSGRDAVPGRRIRLRQVDGRQAAAAPARADRRPIRLDGEDITHLAIGDDAAAPPAHADGVPGPVCVAQPAHAAGRIVAEPLENYSDITPQRARGARRRAVRARRPARRRDAALPVRVLRRPAPAPRHRARAGAQPGVIVADEPVSALDVSVQAQVLNLLMDLQEELGLAYLFVSHDLGVVEHIGHRVAVMYLGRIVELAEQGRAVRDAAASLHAGADGGGADRRSAREARAHRAAGRRAEADQSAAGLPLPHPLPVRVRPLQQVEEPDSSQAPTAA